MKNKSTLWLFVLCAIIVVVTQLILLQPIIRYQLFNLQDDWGILMKYKLASSLPILDRIFWIWKTNGLHDSAAVLHIGMLNEMFGTDYQKYQYTNIFLKILATLTVFPLILVIFKNRALAFFTTLLYGISSGTAGSFSWIMKGGYMLAIALMNLFLISYYYMLTKKSNLLMLLAMPLLFLSYLLAPPRIFPIFALIILTEIFWVIKMGVKKHVLSSLIRLALFFTPVIFVISQVPVSPCCPVTKLPIVLFNYIIVGNWHNLLSPFGGLGFSVLTNDYWKFFGILHHINLFNFREYLLFLIKGPFLIFTFLTFILSKIITQNRWKFFLQVTLINISFEVLMFFILSHHASIPKESLMLYNPYQFTLSVYPTLVGVYMLIISFFAFLEWRRETGNYLLMALWIGPLFAFIFLVGMWLILGYLINAQTSVHFYHLIPPIGVSVFVAAILLLIYQKYKKSGLSRSLAIFTIFIIITTLFLTSKLEIARVFYSNNPERISYSAQQTFHDKIQEKLGYDTKSGNFLIYFDPNPNFDLHKFEYYRFGLALYPEAFEALTNSRRYGKTTGCIAWIKDMDTLKSAIREENQKIGFVYRGKCLVQSDGLLKIDVDEKEDLFYGTDEFYVFRFVNGEPMDITRDILNQL